MLGSLKEKAAKLAASATDAVSDIDMSSIKGKATSTVSGVGNTISQKVSVTAERVKDRVSDPADAYDEALNNLIKVLDLTGGHKSGVEKAVERLKQENPYRS